MRGGPPVQDGRVPMAKRTIRDIEVRGKRVLVRVDLNAPQHEDGTVSDDTRLRAVRPTLQYLRSHGARIILMSHLGRPKGKVDEKFRMAPIAERLSAILSQPVPVAPDVVGAAVEEQTNALGEGQILLLENLRFYPGEEKNDLAFASQLARLGDVYVDDAFGSAHRAHASTVGVAGLLPAVAGLLMEKELEALGSILESPQRPFAALIGGSKVSSKLEVLQSLLKRVDVLIVGGGMAGTFLVGRGLRVGDSLLEQDLVPAAQDLERQAEAQGVRFVLSQDVVVADRFAANAETRTVDVDAIPEGYQIMDIGPKTIAAFEEALRGCKTVLWNGPVGVFEMERFAVGTNAIARFLSESQAITVVGGGDSVAAIEQQGLADRFTHVSTGGGATLEFLEGKTLPGVAALEDRR